VNPQDIADRLEVLASRIRRMLPPSPSNLHRYHEDKSEIANDLAELARAIAPGRSRRRRLDVALSAERSGRSITTSQVINGRHVQVQRRRPFAIHIG
jgi:hypothetical protein